ncbi:unnamed protein product [Durusdinium trenchii]|uniref:EF-hand domain-containing protein n=1 Tax=Durusdinium trenchii TaxID=1381693 RepID=A0ABP0I0Z2_9DINO
MYSYTCAANPTVSESGEVHRLVSDALQESHEKFMRRLDQWLTQLECRLHLDDAYLYEADIMKTTSHASMKTTSQESEPETASPSVAHETGHGVGSHELRMERRISESSYDLAKKEASKIEVFLDGEINPDQPDQRCNACDAKPKSCFDRVCPRYKKIQSFLRPIVKNPKFEMFFAVILVANSLYIGAQLQYMSTSQSTRFEPAFMIAHVIFASLFTLECMLELVGLGIRKFLFSAGWFWGWLDVLVVISAWMEFALDITSQSSSGSNTGVRILKVFRFTRLLQGLRSLRIIRFVGGLRILVVSMFDATRALSWALLLFALVVYVFGVVFSNAALDSLPSGDAHPELVKYWGSVDRAIATLYRSILGGLDWGDAADALLGTNNIIWVHVFYFYIGFICLLILNVMTGVFCNSAIRAAEHDHDIMMQNRHRFRNMATNLFQKMDDSGYGSITIDEFEKLFEDEDMQAFLDSIEISATDAWTLFASLDIDGDKVISVEEFTEGCLKLHGPARSVDLYALRQQNVKMREQMHQMSQSQNRIVEAIRARAILTV